ncbi:MAG TPA: hypothetical protein VFB85_11490 [Vicinamibacterales bacterium]|nr:hypothetical protein [Vicinamibacterales bacterium]
MTTPRLHIIGIIAACAFAMLAETRVQQTAAAPQTPAQKILVAGENPAITLRDKEGGAALTSVNFWRVHWSPVGSGAVCFVTVTGQGSGDLRVAVHDNPKVLDYVTKELMSSLMTNFNTPPYTPVRGTIAQSGDTVNERRETCTSDTHNIELVWRGFSEPTWVDIKPGANVLMTFTMVMASGADVIINGKKAPGGVFRGGPGSFPPSFLALNETWRR